MKTCVIGLGNMGSAVLSILAANFEVDGCRHTDDVNEKLEDCEAFIIAVKPQGFDELVDSVKVDLSNKLAISIMAGVTLEKLVSKLGTEKVVRTIPNLALKVGRSLTPWIAAQALDSEEMNFVRDVLQAFGEELELKVEEDINTIGAISGCGPAYFAFLTEQCEKAAMKYGFTPEQSRKIAETTFLGSAELLKQEGWSAEELRARITSKGGSTNAAITHLEARQFDQIFLEGIEAAVKRTRELNG